MEMEIVDVSAFKQFLLNNNILATTAGVLIAYSAWDFIQSLVGDLLLPGFYYLFVSHVLTLSPTMSKVFKPVHKLDVSNFVARTLSFLLVIVLTFYTIQYIVGHWIQSNGNAQGVDPSAIKQHEKKK